MAFKATQGKVFRGRVDFVGASEVKVTISGSGVGGGFKASDYALMGLPLVRAVEIIKVNTAADGETYSATIRGRKFTVTAGSSSTPTTIRNLLKTAIDAAAAALGISTATSSTDAVAVTALVPGIGLDLSVLAQTEANMTVSSRSIETAAGTVGIVDKANGRFTARANAAITASFDVVIVG